MNVRLTPKLIMSVLIIISSVVVCIIGVSYQMKKEHSNKVASAKLTFANELVTLQKAQKQVNSYYLDNTYEFMVSDIKQEQLDTLEKTVSIIKTEPEDFELMPGDFTDNSLEESEQATQTKKDILNKLTDLKIKNDVQVKIAALFLQAPDDWQVNTGNNVIAEKATMEKIENIRKMITEKKGVWKESMLLLLKSGQEQVEQYTTLKKSINEQLTIEGLSESATLTSYFLLYEEVETIRNEQLKIELSTKLDEMYALLMGPTSVDSTSTVVNEESEYTEEALLE